MAEIKLSKRLQKIFELVPECRTFADVGTDHALLPIKTVLSGKAERAILTDINEGPLKAADKNIGLYGADRTKFDLRLGDGLCPILPEEAEITAICGMGGLLIASILERGKMTAKTAKKLILSPNTCWEELRRYLSENGYRIINEETLAEDGHPYLIIEAVYDGIKREISDCYLGDFLFKMDPGYAALLRKRSENVLLHVESEFHRNVIKKLENI